MIKANHLVYFACVVKHRSFSVAAKEVRVSKSTLSRAVIDLEQALRASLLTRTSRRVDVTPAGERLYARCLSVYNAVLAAQKALENIEAERNITPTAHRETSAVDQ
ncbi:LysR family transcriptional regulator [Paraburkholderia sp. RL17-373-BIF-A]|uniref:LysR family transcriptional regulator n=1 Tax=Paraburkholderia sp. RL17-373-BIF-A TaxID=3031629 RepID=UPI0038BC0E5D